MIAISIPGALPIWTAVLRHLNVDFETFAAKEIEQGVHESCWTENTLLKLLATDWSNLRLDFGMRCACFNFETAMIDLITRWCWIQPYCEDSHIYHRHVLQIARQDPVTSEPDDFEELILNEIESKIRRMFETRIVDPSIFADRGISPYYRITLRGRYIRALQFSIVLPLRLGICYDEFFRFMRTIEEEQWELSGEYDSMLVPPIFDIE